MYQSEKTTLEKYINQFKSVKYFEFGSGSSTVRACNNPNVSSVTSVESDADFIEKIKQSKLSVTPNFIHINFKCKQWGYPVDPSPSPLWELYSNCISQTEEKYNIILNDGRFRVACASSSYLHLENDGYLIVHDYQRKCYKIIETLYEVVDSVDRLYIFKRKLNKENEAKQLWMDYKHVTS